VGVVLGLLCFNILNVDLTTAREKYDSSMEWVSDQGQKFKDFALGHIPGGASTGAGLFFGFRRKT